jgi:hypothetical protein
LNKEALDIETQLRSLEQELHAIRRIRQELEVDNARDGSATAGQGLEDVYTFVGEVRQALRAIKEVEDPSGLAEQHKTIQDQIRDIQSELAADRLRVASEDPMAAISKLIQEHAMFLELGHSDRIPSIDIRELNIRFERVNSEGRGKTDLLWEIGSGANWMGYHLATFLAIHEFLASHLRNPVPTFLVIDQPSQVYFPSDTYRETIEESDGEVKPDSEQLDASTGSSKYSDLVKTRKIFELLASVRNRPTFDLQVIVLEHADETTWVGLKDIVEKVRDWRSSGDRLIPPSWFGPGGGS